MRSALAHQFGGYARATPRISPLPAFSNADPSNLPALRHLLSRMRRNPCPFPEHVFIPIIQDLRRAGLSLQAIYPPAPSTSPSPSSSPLPIAPAFLALPFISSSLRRYPSLSPNLLTFNLLKALCRSGSLDHALSLLRDRHLNAADGLHLPLRPDVYSYSTLIETPPSPALAVLTMPLPCFDEMQLDGVAP